MAWTGVVTNGGADVFSQWVAGTTLTLNTAKAGSGTYSEALLVQQTELRSIKATATIEYTQKVDDGLKLKLQITPGATAYTLNQFGVYGNLTGGTQKLLAIFQNSDGISIPSSSEAPEFVYSFYAVIACTNVNDFEFNISTSTYITHETLAETVEKEAFVTLTAAGWTTVGTGSYKYYTQTVSVESINAKMKPEFYLEPTALTAATVATVRKELFGFGYIGDAIASDGSITFYCPTDVPLVNLTIRLRDFTEKED